MRERGKGRCGRIGILFIYFILISIVLPFARCAMLRAQKKSLAAASRRVEIKNATKHCEDPRKIIEKDR